MCHLPHTVDGKNPPPCLWIDHFGLDQANTQDVRRTLGLIPQIYRTFDVAILLPGSMCECNITGRRLQGQELSSCPNDIIFSSWASRLWPRQELLYARDVHLRYVDGGLSRCPRWWNDEDTKDGRGPKYLYSSEMNQLLPFTRRWLTVAREGLVFEGIDATKEDEAETTAWTLQTQLRLTADEALQSLKAMMIMWPLFRLDNPENATQKMLDLLAGKNLFYTENQLKYESMTEEAHLMHFMTCLNETRVTHRKASKDHDYVLAVWPECPKYIIPENYMDLSLSELMQNAVDQLESKWHRKLATPVPRGLFGDPDASNISWCPKSFMSTIAPVTNAGDLYRSICPYYLDQVRMRYIDSAILLCVAENNHGSGLAPKILLLFKPSNKASSWYFRVFDTLY